MLLPWALLFAAAGLVSDLAMSARDPWLVRKLVPALNYGMATGMMIAWLTP
jgi:hypothetical protein